MVLHNGTYEVTGGQPIPGPANLDFAGMARAAGIARSYDFDELDAYVAALPGILSGQGPVFVNLRVTPDDAPLPPPSRQPLPQRAVQLMQALGVTH